MSNIRELVEGYVKRVKDLSEHVRGNEQATKQSLIGPFFTMLGYDLTDPRECMPEYRADFGKERSVKPIDWVFLNNGAFAFFVEAKEIGKKLGGYDEQLGDYFAKEPAVKLGILTNGAHWRFFTDVVNPNVMDKEPFAKWDVVSDDQPPFDVITLLQKSQFNPELIRTYAQRQRAQNLLVGELTRLLEPAPEFTKLAVANIETRNLTAAVVESWKAVVGSALNEWAKQRLLTAALTLPPPPPAEGKPEGGQVVTTQEELDAFAIIKELLGDALPVLYEDTVAYFKVHLAERRTWVMCRLYLGRKRPMLMVPLSAERVTPLAGGRPTNPHGAWTAVMIESIENLRTLGPLLKEAYLAVKSQRAAGEPPPATDLEVPALPPALGTTP